MTFVRYPYLWLPLLIVFGVVPTLLVPFVGLFFAIIWAVVVVVVAVGAMVAAAWELVAGLRAAGRPLRRRWRSFVRAGGTAQAGASGFDGSPSLGRDGLLRAPARSASAEQRKPETER